MKRRFEASALFTALRPGTFPTAENVQLILVQSAVALDRLRHKKLS